jgi:hypothetical protein
MIVGLEHEVIDIFFQDTSSYKYFHSIEEVESNLIFDYIGICSYLDQQYIHQDKSNQANKNRGKMFHLIPWVKGSLFQGKSTNNFYYSIHVVMNIPKLDHKCTGKILYQQPKEVGNLNLVNTNSRINSR